REVRREDPIQSRSEVLPRVPIYPHADLVQLHTTRYGAAIVGQTHPAAADFQEVRMELDLVDVDRRFGEGNPTVALKRFTRFIKVQVGRLPEVPQHERSSLEAGQ